MFRKRDPKYSFLTIATDAAAVTAAYLFAYWFRFSNLFIAVEDLPAFSDYVKALIVIVPTVIITFKVNRLYSIRSPLSKVDEFISVIKATTLVFVFFMAVTFAYREFTYSRIVIGITWGVSIVLILLVRNYIRIVERKERKVRSGETRLLIIGINRNARKLIERFHENPRYGFKVVGILSEGSHGGDKHLEGVPILGGVDTFDEVTRKHAVNEVILADPDFSRDQTTEIMLKCESQMIGFKLVADFYGLVTSRVDIEYISDVPLLGLKDLPLDDVWNRIAKRLVDVSASAFGLALFAPIALPIMLWIKFSDGGPVFYTQERMGQDGRVFTLFKLRTMRVDAESGTGPVWAKENDDRVTSIGRLLRRTNLDEMPQLWNVLVGHMSLVGPRPERPNFVEQFKEQIPRYMARHKIKSGITGWAQVNGYRGNTSLTERVKYDLYYIENWSLLLDVKIILMTFFAFKNAY